MPLMKRQPGEEDTAEGDVLLTTSNSQQTSSPLGAGDEYDYLEVQPNNSQEAFLQRMKPTVYPQRWVQLGYLSMLALMSDWICFSLAASPEAFEAYYDIPTASSLIDMFLFTNVASSFAVTDIVARFGMKRTMRAAAILMTVGCWFRSGFSSFIGSPSLAPSSSGSDENTELVPYSSVVLGTILVGAAQPFFQCTPPLLSAQWFASDERATSTAVALNFNQVGIATAFLVGGGMANTTKGIRSYFTLISIFCTILMAGTFLQFQELPPTPPSTSEIEKMIKGKSDPPFHVSVKKFFATPGFTRALASFICSISITNIVGTFIDDVMERGGISGKLQIALAGAAFEIAIVAGGIMIGGYVDHTKQYKRVTLMCLAVSALVVIPLGLTGHKLGPEPLLLVISLVVLGLVAGPIQPINAELAVDVTYPSDETAVESVQQIGGNLVSALLVPVAERASKQNFEIFAGVPVMESDIRGDVILLVFLALATYFYFSGFSAPLKRTIADRNDEEGRKGIEMLPRIGSARGDEMGKLLLPSETES